MQAALLNNVGTALLLAALLQPVLSLVREGRPIRLVDAVATGMLVIVGVILHLAARAIAARLED